jgi:hypothetical protein
VPEHSCSPTGKIRLDVLFTTQENLRRQPIWFKVVNLSSPYHALLGRHALAKFMAVPHYTYLKMKMPGPKGIITIAGCYQCLMECASTGSKLAESLVIAEELRQIKHSVDMTQAEMPAAQKPAGELQFQPARDTKKILLDEA